MRLGGNSTDVKPQDAMATVDTIQKVLIAGVLGLSIGSTYMFWGSEFLAIAQLAIAGALAFSPLYLPSIVGTGNGAAGEAMGHAMGALQAGGYILGLVGFGVLVVDLVTRVTQRTKKGTKADQLKYGKGIKEEKGKKNVFMGKCWQLPYCREFVRERCPIYHAKTTCWKELVGCMCEEAVIRNAMENKPIPKDALLAGKMIPRNNKLTEPQKKERCRNCVIYNEHQRHKYKLTMPATTVVFGLIYVLLHGPLIEMMNGLETKVNKIIQSGTLGKGQTSFEAPAFFTETLLFVLFIIALTYVMKTMEYLIFQAKI